MSTKAEKIKDICDKIAETYRTKNSDYGDSASSTFRKYGAVSYLSRISDKLSRVENLSLYHVNAQVPSESIRDTLLDLATYAIMFAVDLEERAPIEITIKAAKKQDITFADIPPYYDGIDV